MRCARCRADNREGRRFCGECGLPLPTPCPFCGFSNEGNEKVSGVVVKPDEVEIHIVARYPLPSPIPEISRSIIERVAPRASDRRIVVVVDDLEVVAS